MKISLGKALFVAITIPPMVCGFGAYYLDSAIVLIGVIPSFCFFFSHGCNLEHYWD